MSVTIQEVAEAAGVSNFFPCSLHCYPLLFPVQIRRTGEVDIFRALAGVSRVGWRFCEAKYNPTLTRKESISCTSAKGIN